MTDWGILIQTLNRVPGAIVWMLFVVAAFMLHLRRPGPATVAQIGGGIVAFAALCVLILGSTLMQMQIGKSGGIASAGTWASLLSGVSFVYQGGALVYAIALIAVLNGLPRRDPD